ncbi:MAG: hypothetical protein KBF59_10950 [Ignavibacterium sp.]|nr:hypothetical protein [Ignavibacterium sp.]
MKLQQTILMLIILSGSKYAYTQDYMFNVIDQTWMAPDMKLRQFEIEDTLQTGNTFFIRKEKLDKFIPKGWKLPDLNDINLLIKNLDGPTNDDGGKIISANNLSKIMPFRLNGIYYESMKQLIGVHSMTAYYTAADIEKSFDSEMETTQVSLYIHSNRNGELIVEPLYSKIKNGQIYCNVLFIKKI